MADELPKHNNELCKTEHVMAYANLYLTLWTKRWCAIDIDHGTMPSDFGFYKGKWRVFDFDFSPLHNETFEEYLNIMEPPYTRVKHVAGTWSSELWNQDGSRSKLGKLANLFCDIPKRAKTQQRIPTLMSSASVASYQQPEIVSISRKQPGFSTLR